VCKRGWYKGPVVEKPDRRFVTENVWLTTIDADGVIRKHFYGGGQCPCSYCQSDDDEGGMAALLLGLGSEQSGVDRLPVANLTPEDPVFGSDLYVRRSRKRKRDQVEKQLNPYSTFNLDLWRRYLCSLPDVNYPFTSIKDLQSDVERRMADESDFWVDSKDGPGTAKHTFSDAEILLGDREYAQRWLHLCNSLAFEAVFEMRTDVLVLNNLDVHSDSSRADVIIVYDDY
jgi:hypothetical protein